MLAVFLLLLGYLTLPERVLVIIGPKDIKGGRGTKEDIRSYIGLTIMGIGIIFLIEAIIYLVAGDLLTALIGAGLGTLLMLFGWFVIPSLE